MEPVLEIQWEVCKTQQPWNMTGCRPKGHLQASTSNRRCTMCCYVVVKSLVMGLTSDCSVLQWCTVPGTCYDNMTSKCYCCNQVSTNTSESSFFMISQKIPKVSTKISFEKLLPVPNDFKGSSGQFVEIWWMPHPSPLEFWDPDQGRSAGWQQVVCRVTDDHCFEKTCFVNAKIGPNSGAHVMPTLKNHPVKLQ